MSELVLGALLGVVLAAVAALVNVAGRLYDLRQARLLLESLMGAGGFDPRLVRLLADVAARRQRLGLVLALVVIGIVAAALIIWRMAAGESV
jgi:hypothetical protein